MPKIFLLGDGPYMSCDECFDAVDRAVEELLGAGEPLEQRFSSHLHTCPACKEEAFSLAELIAADYGLSEEAAFERLESEIV